MTYTLGATIAGARPPQPAMNPQVMSNNECPGTNGTAASANHTNRMTIPLLWIGILILP